MATDLATLALRVTLDGGAAATQGLDAVAAAGARAETTTKRLGAATGGLTRLQQDLVARAREVYQAAALVDVQNNKSIRAWEKQRDVIAQLAARLQQTAVVETELASATQLVMQNQAAAADYAKRLSAAQAEMTASAGRAAPGINSVRSALTSMAASTLNTIPGVAQLTGVLGSMALGSALMAGVLAAVTAVSLLYERFTSAARKAKDEQDRLTDSLVRWYRTKAAGGAGAQEITAATSAIVQEQRQIVELTAKLAQLNNSYNAKTGLRDEAAIGATKNQIASLTAAIDEQRKAIDERQADRGQAIGQAALEIERQKALNAAYREAPLALQLINIEYDRRAQLLANRTSGNQAERATLDALTNEMATQRAAAARLADAQRDLEAANKSTAASMDKIAAALQKTAPAWTLNERQYERIIALAKQLNEIHEKIRPATLPKGETVADAKAAVEAALAPARQATETMLKDMQRAFAGFFENVFTNGVTSFRSLFDEIKRLFFKLIADMIAADIMKKLAKPISGALSGILGTAATAGAQTSGGASQNAIFDIPTGSSKLATAGAGLGIAAGAFSVGSIIGGLAPNRAVAGLGGAAGGAALGAGIGALGGPIGVVAGAFIGGVAGAVGGLLGFHKGLTDAEKALQELKRVQVADTLANWRAQVEKTAIAQQQAAELDLRLKWLSIRQMIEETEAGKKQENQREKDLAEADRIYQEAQAALAESANGVRDAFLGTIHAVNGYKLNLQLFNHAPAIGPAPTPAPPPPKGGSGSSGGGDGNDTDGRSLNVTLNVDGKTMGRLVVRGLQGISQDQYGTTDRWNEVLV